MKKQNKNNLSRLCGRKMRVMIDDLTDGEGEIETRDSIADDRSNLINRHAVYNIIRYNASFRHRNERFFIYLFRFFGRL